MEDARKQAQGLSLSKKALILAKYAHKGQFRKGGTKPYIIHPYSVYGNLLPHTNDEVTLAAALLHDVIEDVNPDHYSEADMLVDFNEEVVAIVRLVSKDHDAPSWRAGNEAYIAGLVANPDKRALLVCAADKLDNLSTSLYDYAVTGEALWDRFHAGKEDQKWWYRSVFELLNAHLAGHPLLKIYATKLAQLESL